MATLARGALWIAAWSLGWGGPAFAQDSAEEVRQRMDDRYFFVRELDRGWEPLLADFAQQAAGLGEAERRPVLVVRDTAIDDYAGRIETKGEKGEARAFELYVMLSAEAVDPGTHPAFARKAATIEVRQARRAEEKGLDDLALDFAQKAAERSPGFDDAYDVIARLALKASDSLEAKDDFFGALASLEKNASLLPEASPARGGLVARKEKILRETGEIAVDWLGTPEVMARVKSPKTDFMAGTLEFRLVEGVKAPPPQEPRKPMRVRNGRYEITQRGAGSAFTRIAGEVTVVAKGTAVTLLSALPDGMVLIPARPGQDAFLIDVTEVTVSEYERPGAGGSGGNRRAQGGVGLTQARVYARAAGKDLPTHAQWMTAAFGDPQGASRRYPWGNDPPVVGTHFVGDKDEPQPVGTCPAGRSAHGCLDMAGNVWEWLDNDRFIGGGYRWSELTHEIQPTEGSADPVWVADFLRDAAPSDELFDDETRLTTQERAKYWNYRQKHDPQTLATIGLRCVVNLGRPWRQRS